MDMHASDMAGINGVSQAFAGTYLPGRCVPLGPHTAPLTPNGHSSFFIISHGKELHVEYTQSNTTILISIINIMRVLTTT